MILTSKMNAKTCVNNTKSNQILKMIVNRLCKIILITPRQLIIIFLTTELKLALVLIQGIKREIHCLVSCMSLIQMRDKRDNLLKNIKNAPIYLTIAFNAKVFQLEYVNGKDQDLALKLLQIKIINKLKPQKIYGTLIMESVTRTESKHSASKARTTTRHNSTIPSIQIRWEMSQKLKLTKTAIREVFLEDISVSSIGRKMNQWTSIGNCKLLECVRNSLQNRYWYEY